MTYNNIRAADAKDMEELLRILDQLSPRNTDDKSVSKEKLTNVMNTMASSGNHYLAVYDDGGRIAGTAMLVVQYNLSHGGRPYGHIENVVIDEKYRGKGIGKALVDYLVEEARKGNCYKVILNCSEDNISFYKKCGFNQNGKIEMRINLD